MNIALDFDDTYTADPELWDAFIQAAKSRGHVVYCVTARIESPENKAQASIPGIETIFCGLASKVHHVEQTLGIKIGIWIDDNPTLLLLGKAGPVDVRYHRTVPVRHYRRRGTRK